MRCEVCGAPNVARTHTCASCGAPLPDAPPPHRRTPALLFTVPMALLLLVAGLAAYDASSLLVHAMRPASASDVAQLVCTAFLSQRYDLLIAHIDPAPVAGIAGASGAFDAGARAALARTLAALDATEGHVTDCAYHAVNATASRAQFAYTLRRAQMPIATGLIVTETASATGAWELARDSNFTGSG